MIKNMEDMLDGEFGIVVKPKLSSNRHYVGRLVHCFNAKIISIGKKSGDSWNVLKGNTNQVEILDESTIESLIYFIQNPHGKITELGGS